MESEQSDEKNITEAEAALQKATGETLEESYAKFLKELEEPLSNWKQKKSMKEIKDGYMLNVYQKKVEGHKADFVRLEATMEGLTQDKMADFYRNPSQEQIA